MGTLDAREGGTTLARDDFAGQSGGGGVNNFTFTVTDAWFGKSDRFSEKTGLDTIFCHWVGTTDLEDERFQTLDQDGFHPSFNLGEDWVPSADGKTVKYDGPSRKPRLGKWYGRLSDAVVELTDHVANTDQDPLAGSNHPSDATIWIGTQWYMEEIERDFGQMGKASHLMPTKYLGKVAVSASPTPADGTSPVAASPSTNGAGSDPRSTVELLAKSAATYAEFQSLALQVPGVTSDPALIADIADESKLYASAKG